MRQKILITGTSRGIGEYLTKHYARDSEAIVIGCSRGPKPANSNFENYTHHQADVTDEKSVKELFEKIRDKYGHLHVLINNAGTASMNLAQLTPMASFERIMNTNFAGTFLMSREAVKLMWHTSGRIINISSIAVPLTLEGESVYAASKSAVETFTKILAREVGSRNITCNAVGPGPIETDLIKNVPQKKIKALLERLAIKRMCRFEDVSNIIDFLISPDSDYITGQVIYLGGPHGN